jgi:hypothetical protein
MLTKLLPLLLIARVSPAMTTQIQHANSDSTGARGKFASEEIRREAATQSYKIRV